MINLGLKVTAVGFGTVFMLLVLLWFIISLQTKLLSGASGKKPEAAKAAPAPVAAAPVAATKQDDTELVAVIAAAIAACGSTARIKTITRVNGSAASAWTSAGLSDAMNQY